MKKLLTLVISITLLCSLGAGTLSSTNASDENPLNAQQISVLLNGKKIEFDVAPIIENDRTLVPVRAIFEALDMEVSYDNGKIAAEKEGLKIDLTVDSDIAYVDGEQKSLDVPSKVVDGRTIVPLRFIGESTGLIVDYNADTRIVTMNAPVKVLEPKNHDLITTWDDSATVIELNNETVTISEAGTYVVSGTISDGSIIIDVTKNDRVHLILNGVDITNKKGAAIYAPSSDKVVLTLADGTTNTVTDGGENYAYSLNEEQEPNAAIFIKDDLTINGNGTLTVNAGFNNGIGTKDDLLIVGGNFIINAVNNGMDGNDSVGIKNGSFHITAGNDGIQADNVDIGWIIIEGGTFDITAAFDGIQAETDMTVTGGDFSITTGGGSASAEMDSNKFGDPDTTTGSMGGGRGQMPGGRFQIPSGMDMEVMQKAMEIVRAAGPNGLTDEQLQELKDLGLTDEQIEQLKTMTQGGGRGGMGGGQMPEGGISNGQQTQEENTDSLKGLKAKMLITITGGDFNIDAADDGIHSNDEIFITGGNLVIQSGDDGIRADSNVKIAGGEINITYCYEGIEGMTVTVSDGKISIVSTDDGINPSDGSGMGGGMFKIRAGEDGMPVEGGMPSGRGGFMPNEGGMPTEGAQGNPPPNTQGNRQGMGGMPGGAGNENLFLRILGGEVNIIASGDGIDSNGNIFFEGGSLNVSGHSMGAEGAIDMQSKFTVSGGEFVTAGSSYSPTTATQPVILVSYKEQQPHGSVIAIKDANGDVLLEYTSEKAYSMSAFTSPSFAVGETYSLSINGEKRVDITLSDMITSIGDDGGAYNGRQGGNMIMIRIDGLDDETVQKALEIIRAADGNELTEEQLQALYDLGLTDEQIEMLKNVPQRGGRNRGSMGGQQPMQGQPSTDGHMPMNREQRSIPGQ